MKISGINKIHHGDAVKLLKDDSIFPDKSIDLIMTSPPYADQRAYGNKRSSSSYYFQDEMNDNYRPDRGMRRR